MWVKDMPDWYLGKKVGEFELVAAGVVVPLEQPHSSWWLKMQNFLGSLCLQASFNIIINITLLINLEHNTCSHILSSSYMAATVANGEGYFDMKMQIFRP